MLASLLPGLRDVRTPLATGYLYAFLLWIVFGKNLLPAIHDNELFERIGDLSDRVGTTASLAGLSFVCYLLGSVLTVRKLPARIDPVRSRGARFYTDDLIAWIVEQSDSLAARGWSVQGLYDRGDIPQSFRTRVRQSVDEAGRRLDPDSEASDLTDVNWSRPIFNTALIAEVNESHEALVTRLQIERETLYNEYDRVRSEAELRFSIFAPLVGVVIVAAVLWSSWALALGVLPSVLLVQGVFLHRDSMVRVEQAVARGIVTLPILGLLNEIGTPTADLARRSN